MTPRGRGARHRSRHPEGLVIIRAAAQTPAARLWSGPVIIPQLDEKHGSQYGALWNAPPHAGDGGVENGGYDKKERTERIG